MECSTPFGITEVGIARLDAVIAQRDVLNAFRHHRGGHCAARTGLHAANRAQRLSASQRWALSGSGSSMSDSSSCSTPFGITEVGIHVDGLVDHGSDVCSTPFGITEVGMAARDRNPTTMMCAQRLSASQRWACW